MSYREYVLEHWREIRVTATQVLEMFDSPPMTISFERAAMRKEAVVRDLVRKLAGPCATIVRGPEETALGWSIWVDVPSPEGLLLP